MSVAMKQTREIAQEYQEFTTVAEEVAIKETAHYLGEKRAEKYEDSFTRHLIGMLEMYHIKYGVPITRRRNTKLAPLMLLLTLVSLGVGFLLGSVLEISL